MTAFNLLLEKIHLGKNPYAGYPSGWEGTWYADPGAARGIFRQCIERTKPGIIIEVGSFVGESAIHMARVVKELGLDAAILCVDTWYAGFDHWVGAREKIQMHFGRPDLYYKFVANVIANNCQDVIVPLAMDSIGAARVIDWLGIVADLVYVDASHEQGDVFRDYVAYWNILRPGGGLLADDLSNHFPGCLHDWEVFTEMYGLAATLTEGEKALVIKP